MLRYSRANGAAVAQRLYTPLVGGSNPSSPTIFSQGNSHFFGRLPVSARSIWRFLPLPSRVALLEIIICKRGSDSLFACNSKFMKSLSALASLQKGWTVEGGGDFYYRPNAEFI